MLRLKLKNKSTIHDVDICKKIITLSYFIMAMFALAQFYYWPIKNSFFWAYDIDNLYFEHPVLRPMNRLLYSILLKYFICSPQTIFACGVILHTLNAIMVYLLFREILQRENIAYLSGILFLIMPAVHGVVLFTHFYDWLLATFFILLSFWLYIKSIINRSTISFSYYFFSIIAYLLAILTRESFLLNFLPLLFFYTVLNISNAKLRTNQEVFAYLKYFILFEIVYFIAQVGYLHGGYLNMDRRLSYLAKPHVVIINTAVNIISLFISPYLIRQNEASMPVSCWFLAIGFFIVVSYVLILMFTKSKIVKFNLLWCGISILPFGFRNVPCYRDLYFPAIGASVILALLLIDGTAILFSKMDKKLPHLIGSLLIGIVLLVFTFNIQKRMIIITNAGNASKMISNAVVPHIDLSKNRGFVYMFNFPYYFGRNIKIWSSVKNILWPYWYMQQKEYFKNSEVPWKNLNCTGNIKFPTMMYKLLTNVDMAGNGSVKVLPYDDGITYAGVRYGDKIYIKDFNNETDLKIYGFDDRVPSVFTRYCFAYKDGDIINISNSIFSQAKIIFKVKELPDNASSASIIGDFNNWDKMATPLIKTNSGWEGNVTLQPGRYLYKILINNEDCKPDLGSAYFFNHPKYGRCSLLLVPNIALPLNFYEKFNNNEIRAKFKEYKTKLLVEGNNPKWHKKLSELYHNNGFFEEAGIELFLYDYLKGKGEDQSL